MSEVTASMTSPVRSVAPSSWWNERKPDEPLLFGNSKIRTWAKTCFNEIISHPVPLDMNTLTALKRCALGLDLYLWLTYRIFTLRAPLRLTCGSCTSSSTQPPSEGPISKPSKSFVARFYAS